MNSKLTSVLRHYKTVDFIKPGYSIGIFQSRNSKQSPRHCHEFIEIVYIFSGTAQHAIDDTIYEVERGDLLFINYGSEHSFTAHESFEYVNICFSPEVVGDSIITAENAPTLLTFTAFNDMRKEKNSGKFSFSGNERKQVEWLIQQMLYEYEDDQPYANKIMESYMNVLFTTMLRKAEEQTEAIARDMWDELKEYIDKNPDEKLTLGVLAKKSFYNPSYFSRLFKAKFGLSLTEYVGKRRVDAAITLLKDGTVGTDEIIRRCGFADRSAYYHAFAKHTGKAPSEFRQKNKST